MKHYLFDASAFMLLIKKADTPTAIDYLQNSYIIDLTFYEVGNAIWKESTLTKLLTPENAKVLQKTAKITLTKTDQLSNTADSFEKILEISKTEKLTFYDSSYIHFAKENKLQLITEDKQLKTKAQKYINTQNTATVLTK